MAADTPERRGTEKRGAQSFLTEVNDELNNLQTGDPLLPPDANAASGLEVVPVHDDVDGQVEGDGDPGNSSVADQLAVAKNSSGAMVVAVEESC